MDKVTVDNVSSKILTQEKLVKATKFSQEAQHIHQYLQLLREDRFQKLLKSNDDREMHILLGELRSYDKLIPLLSA